MSEGLVDALDVVSASYNYSHWIYSLLRPYVKGAVLDVGSGFGVIPKQFERTRVTKLILTDIGPEMLRLLQKERFPVNDCETIELDITSDSSLKRFPHREIDVVTCVNVLEHIPDDVAALRHMYELLKPGGHAVIFVPALQGIYGTLDKCVGHVRRYRRSSLRPAMEKAGFVVERAQYMNMLGIATWFLAGRVRKYKRFSVRGCRRLDRVVPILKGVEKVLRPPIGQSLLMVGRKPAMR